MTTELTLALARIRSDCERAIELGEKATPGQWRAGDVTEHSDCSQSHYPVFWPDCGNGAHVAREADAAFIAHSRTFSPAAARAVLTTINGLKLIAEHGQEPERGACLFDLQTLAEQWPKEEV